ncbi:MAG: hypothetical protein WKF43_04125 [Acidimicrobiales bacterium]
MTRRILAVVPDLMDRSRLRAGAGYEVRFVRVDELADPTVVDPTTVDLVVVDLARSGIVEALAGADLGVDVVGFGPHVDQDLLEAAAMHCTRVLKRSTLFQNWPDV